MAQVKFYLEKRNNEKSKLPLLLMYSFNGLRLQYYTGISIDKKYYQTDYWKKSGDPVKSSAPGADGLNRDLHSLRIHIEKMHSEMKALGKVPTVKTFKSSLDEKFKGKGATVTKGLTMSQAVDLYLTEVKLDKAYNTYRNSNTALVHFKNYWSKKGDDSIGLALQDFDDVVFRDLQLYIQKQVTLNNTAVKYLNVVKRFFNWMLRQKHISGFKFNLSLTENAIDVIYLDEKEVTHLSTVDFQRESLSRVRDVFVFGCLTGMRYVDLKKLKKTDINKDFIRFYNQKNGKTVAQIVPLLPRAKEILERYANGNTLFALPVISNQQMNDRLKELMQEAGFDYDVTIAQKSSTGKITDMIKKKYELIGCHTSRKCFITNSLNRGIPEAVIKMIVGHSKNSKAFAAYYTINEELMKSEMHRAFGSI